jgi:hypothetical protein
LLLYVAKDTNQSQLEEAGKREPLRVNVKVVLALLLVAIAISAAIFWSLQVVETHRRWDLQMNEAQLLMLHLEDAGQLLNSSYYSQSLTNRSYETDEASQIWFSNELRYASVSLNNLLWLDRGHQSELGRIMMMLDALDGHGSYLMNLNATGKSDLADSLFTVGQGVSAAYFNFLNYTDSATGTGPPFWYFGPSPPDETVLKAAVQLANNITAQVGQ